MPLPTLPRTLTARLWLALAACLMASCAVPVAPTGGPPDQTPPTILASSPTNAAVNVTAETVSFTFSEYVDQSAFTRAFSVTPDFDGRLEFKWRKRSVEVVFPEALRENTTYILTLDTNLRDARGVALREPLTLAFSTGPVINQGRISGQVVDAAGGEGVAGFDVFAYIAPDSLAPAVLPERPTYRTQTDPDGRFAFAYMSLDPYFIIALQDQNRNRKPDNLEAFGVPSRPVLLADTVAAGTPLRWLVTQQDTIPPELRQVRALSSRRLTMRYADPVQPVGAVDTTGWQVQDSLSGGVVPIQAVYTRFDIPRQVFLLTDSLQAAPYLLRTGAVADSAGNVAPSRIERFQGVSAADTVRLRFLGFGPVRPGAPAAGAIRLLPAEAPALRLNTPVDEARLRTFVTVRDTSGTARAFTTQTTDGTTYRLRLTPPLDGGQAVEVVVDGRQIGTADSVYVQSFEGLSSRDLGELSGIALATDTTGRVVVELYPGVQPGSAPLSAVAVDTTGRFFFGNLPQASYRFRAFLDRNANLSWDGGQITPYLPAEPITWRADTLRVRPRWENVLPDTLRIR